MEMVRELQDDELKDVVGGNNGESIAHKPYFNCSIHGQFVDEELALKLSEGEDPTVMSSCPICGNNIHVTWIGWN